MLFLCYSLTRHENPLKIFPYGDPPLPTGKLGKLTPPPAWKIRSLPWGLRYRYFLEPHNQHFYIVYIQRDFILMVLGSLETYMYMDKKQYSAFVTRIKAIAES